MKVIICEANQNLALQYAQEIEKIAAAHKIDLRVELCSSALSLLFKLEDIKEDADVILMEVEQPRCNGFVFCRKMRETGRTSEIILMAQSGDFLLQAFDVGVCNYLIKGRTSWERFSRVILNALQNAQQRRQDYLLLNGYGERRQILINSIHYFERHERVITAYYDNNSFDFFSNLSHIEEILEGKGFFRIHRSYLVSLANIHSLRFHQQGEVELRDGTVLPTGRAQYARLKEKIQKYAKCI